MSHGTHMYESYHTYKHSHSNAVCMSQAIEEPCMSIHAHKYTHMYVRGWCGHICMCVVSHWVATHKYEINKLFHDDEWVSFIPWKEPYVPSKEPYIPSKKLYISSKEPYTPLKEPYIPDIPLMSQWWMRHMCDKSYVSYVWQVIYKSYVDKSYVWWTIHMCDLTRTNENEPYCTDKWVMSHIWFGHVTHMNESCHTYE